MIFQANELLAKLKNLTLVGKEDGELEWWGTDRNWKDAKIDEEDILRNRDLMNF